MATDFKCPICKKIFKVGKLHAGIKCPNCHSSMFITREEKLQGHLNYRKNFLFQK